jgi:hypothetical protein
LFWSFEKKGFMDRENSMLLMSEKGLCGMLSKQILVRIFAVLGGLLAPVGGGAAIDDTYGKAVATYDHTLVELI